MLVDLNLSLSKISDIGKKSFALYKRIGITNVLELLYYFPFRYEDFRTIRQIKDVEEGEEITLHVQIELIGNRRSFKSKKMITEAVVKDASESLRVIWFNQPFLIKSLHPGEWIYLSGKIKRDMMGLQMASPTHEKDNKNETVHTARLVPIYSLTHGLTQRNIRFLISRVVDSTKQIPDWLPIELIKENKLQVLPEALRGIHFPKDEMDLKKSTERLKFDELFLVQLQAQLTKKELKLSHAPEIKFYEVETKQLVDSLGFSLTKTQKIAAWEILQDLAKKEPMNRLLSGDVGSGKTVVAALALYNTVLNNFQGVVMVPTEILARQHFETLNTIFTHTNVRIALYTRTQQFFNQEKISKKELLTKIELREVDIIIGTQALLSDGVHFAALGFVVVDEQHRFGVEQRKVIKEKGKHAHFLSMTATPIPRSLALMLYGDLDVSLIPELPPGRKKIITRLTPPHNREKAYEFVRSQVKEGRQIFVICPLISNEQLSNEQLAISNEQMRKIDTNEINNYSPKLSADDKKTVLSEYEKLATEIFPDLKVDYLHGKMKATEKEAVMKRFANQEFDILVSTSVVEVGVNIPNASVMIIEGAESFGLAQLHQFRGRVGRSVHQSYCILFTTQALKGRGQERLTFFEKCDNGFKLAEKDLEIRGPGEVYGTEQSGMLQLRLAKLSDQTILNKARTAAQKVIVDIEKYPTILTKIKKWQERVHLE